MIKLKNITGEIANVLYSQGVIKKNDIDVCKYGLDVFVSSFLEIASILILSAVMGLVKETILLFVSFIPLRLYAGGYHANTKLKCYVISLVMYFSFYGVLKILPDKMYSLSGIALTMLSLVTVLLKAPIIHNNKNVNSIEIHNYRKLSVVIGLIETAVVLALILIFSKPGIAFSIAYGQAAVAVSMIAAIIKSKIKSL